MGNGFEALIIVIIAVVILLILIGIIIGVINSTRVSKERYYENEIECGKEGESIVTKALSIIKSKYVGYLYNDVCLSDFNGNTCEIDHILITRGGTFVIETKNHKGTVYGFKEDDMWRRIKGSYKNVKTDINPVKQNENHLNFLRKLFSKNPPKMESVVIYLIADISNITCKNVFNLDDGIEYMESLTASNKYSLEYVYRNNEEIKRIIAQYSISHEEHVLAIKEKYGYK